MSKCDEESAFDRTRPPAGSVAAETVVDLLERQSARTPALPAIRDAGRDVSYAELWARSGSVARELRRRAWHQEQPVIGLCGRRSADLITGLVGILRSGAAYLPLDPSYPSRRLEQMLEDTKTALVVGHFETATKLPRGQWELVSLDGQMSEDPDRNDRVHHPRPDSLCYVMYTSGSTGAPKGVMLEHSTLSNLIHWQLKHSSCGRGTRTLLFSPLSFDVSFQEIFSTLACGGTLVCISDEDRRDPRLLWEVLVGERIERLFLPFVALQGLALFESDLSESAVALREVITAGEQLQCNEKLRALFRRLRDCRLVNQYGPAETHVVTAYHLSNDPDSWETLPPIGTAIDNVRLWVVTDNASAPATGVPGELLIGGVAVGRGYWGRGDLTAERFTPDPDVPGGRLYRTGDVVAWRPDAALDFVGRADDQLKVRGIRIEPGEVEAAIAAHPSVSEVAVVSEGTDAATRRLIAYVSGAPIETGVLRAFLEQRLPSHMIPATFRVVAELPRTASGKVDRRKLRENGGAAIERIGVEGDGGSRTGKSRVEDAVRRALREALGQPEIPGGFIAAGGDSLSAMTVAARLSEELGRMVPISWILEASSMAELTSRAEVASSRDAMSTRSVRGWSRVTAAQRQLLLEHDLAPRHPPHVVAAELVVVGQFDVEAVRDAARALVQRHDSLRLRFKFENDDYWQEIVPHADPEINIRQVTAETLAGAREIECARQFDLRLPTTPRITIFQGLPRSRLLIVTHHVACDGWSLNLLLKDLAEEYSARVERRPAHHETVVNPRDLRAETDAHDLDEQRRYWRDRLAALVERTQVPHDRAALSSEGPLARISISVHADVWSAVRARARQERVTPFSLLLAALVLVLARRCSIRQVSVAVPMAGRTATGAMQVVGTFVNPVLINVDVDLGEPGAHVLRGVHERLQEAQDRQDINFADVMRLLSPTQRQPRSITQVLFALLPEAPHVLQLGRGRLANVEMDLGVPERTQFDLAMNLVPIENQLRGWIDYQTGLLEEATVRGLVESWREVLNQLTLNTASRGVDLLEGSGASVH